MLKRILFSALFILFIFNNNLLASSIAASYFSHLTAYDWQPISDVEKVLQYEKAKELCRIDRKDIFLSENEVRVGLQAQYIY